MSNPESSEHPNESEAAMTSGIVRRAETGSGALALSNSQQAWTQQQRAALVQLGLDKAPDGDLAVFLHYAQRTGLDPFARQIYMIGRMDWQSKQTKYTIQTSIDGFRIIAERHGQYGGQVGPEWCGEDGEWKDVWLSRKPPMAARVGVIRKDWTKPVYAVATFEEYAAKNKEGKLLGLWSTKPALMIAKCSEALALRKAFPHDLSGIYTSDEMPSEDHNPPLRAVADRVPAEEAVAPSPEIDWDAAMADCGADPAKWNALWAKAPTSELKKRISAEAKAAVNTAKAEEPYVAPKVIDAGAEQDTPPARAARPTKLDNARTANDVFDRLLTTSDFDEAETLATTAPRVDVTGFLTDEIREVLDINNGDRLKLPEFAQLVADYINRRGTSVNAATGGEAA